MSDAKRRILFVITLSEWGGAQSYVLNTAKEAVLRGYDVLVAAGGHDELAKRCSEASIPYHELHRLKRSILPFADMSAVAELKKLMNEWKPDVAYLHSSKAGVIGSLAARHAHVTRVVYRIGGWSFLDPVSPLQKMLRRRSERHTAKLKDAIIVLHPDDEALAKKYRILPRGELAVIPNGIDLESFDRQLRPADEAKRMLDELWNTGVVASLRRASAGSTPDVRRNDATILTIANFFPTKNLLGYLDAIAIVHKKIPSARFLIIGDGPERKQIESKRHHLGLDGVVSLPGIVRDASTLLRGADVFVLPSAKEGMSWALLEAMAAALPCIATDVGASHWMIGKDGWIVPPGDADALARAIAVAVNDPPLARERGDAARREVEWRFTGKRMMEETFRLL
jgi:glycosyltransferase involved in cell wall biosynthesis